MIIIALSGYAGCGKDTAYQLIKDRYNARRFAFADALKKIARYLTWDGNKDENGRRFLQNLGNIAREYNKNVWADLVVNDIEIWSNDISLAVITDFRFPNEVNVLKKRFSKVYTIRILGKAYDLGKNSRDISEHSLDNYKFDYYIDNSGTLDEFKNNLISIITGELGL